MWKLLILVYDSIFVETKNCNDHRGKCFFEKKIDVSRIEIFYSVWWDFVWVNASFLFFYKKSLKKKYSKLWLDIFRYQRVLYKRNRRRMHAGIRFDPPTNRQRYFLSILYTSPATLIHERFERGRSRRIIIFVNATLCPASIEAFLASDGFKTTCFETCLWDFKMLRL